jgi:hypothetical protein
MEMYSKKDQLKKRKPKNEKKLQKSEIRKYTDWIHDRQGGKCFCGCGRPIDEYHHAKYGSFGADKDDRSLVGISRECHYAIHHGSDIVRKKSLEKMAIDFSRVLWEEYKGIA